MKREKQLKTFVMRLIQQSLNEKGELVEEKVKKCMEALKKLPLSKSVIALGLYRSALKREIEKSTVEIESAVEISAAQIQRIVRNVKPEQKSFEVKYKVNSSLLGGMRVKVSDVVYDDTIGKKVLQLKEAVHE